MSPNKPTATLLLSYSPQKARLIINAIRGMNLTQAMDSLTVINKGKSKDIYKLIKSAASNLHLVESDYSNYVISTIVAEEAQILYRMMPRARGSSAKIRRRYSRVKISITSK